MKRQTEKTILFSILALAAILRFYNYAFFSLSNDELSALARLRFNNFSEMIDKGVMIDFHPAGVQVFLFYWIKIFGISELSIRLPFVLFGTGSVFMIYLLGKKWFNSQVGLLAAATLSVLEFPLLYSQIARPYSPGLFFTLLAACFWSEIFVNRIKNQSSDTKINLRLYAGFVLSVCACMYIHYFALLQAGLICITGLFFLSKQNYKVYFISGIAILLLYVPHLKIFLHQMSIGGVGGSEGWLSKPEPDFFWNYIRYAFNYSVFIISLFAIIFICSLVMYRNSSGRNKFRLLAFLLFIVPFTIGYFYSICRNPVLQYSVLLFSFPFLILLLFSFIPGTVQQKFLVTGVFIILLTGSFSTVIGNKYYSTTHFGVFRELAEKTIEFNRKYGEENITRTVNIINPYYIEYYFNKFHEHVNFEQYVCNDYDMVHDFAKLVEESKTTYFMHAWSNTYDSPELEEIVLEKYPFIISKNNYFNSGIILYSQKQHGELRMKEPIFEIKHDFENIKWRNDSLYLNDSVFHSGKQSAFLNDKFEYGPTLESPVKDIGLRKGDTIKISLRIFSLQEPLSAKLVLSIDGNDKSKNVWIGREFKIYRAKANQWQPVFLDYIVSKDSEADDVLKTYVWNDKKESFYIDDFTFKVFR